MDALDASPSPGLPVPARLSRIVRRKLGPATGAALDLAFGTLSLGDHFFDTVVRAADQAGCRMMLEIPAVLFSQKASRAAAIGCGAGCGAEFFFILLDEASGAILIVEEQEVSPAVAEFTRSYVDVLGAIGGDRQLIAPLIQ